ncbi:MAG: hypothetical protein Q8P56_03250 [Candidatus Uhrbacteria bacterium]|nr:hypothetical protein [Candidatus Uhrbacteria bacterium]
MVPRNLEALRTNNENPETRKLTEIIEAGVSRAREFFEKTDFNLGITPSEGEAPSPEEQKNVIEKTRRLVSATVAGVIMAGVIPEALSPQHAEARMHNITVHGEKFEKAAKEAEQELVTTMAKADIPYGTSVLRIGPSEYLPKNMPAILLNAPADKKQVAGNSSFQLKSVEEIPGVRGGKAQRRAIYETSDRKAIKESETIKIPTSVPEDQEITLPLVTNDDQQISLARIEAGYQLPVGDKSHTTTSEGARVQAVSEFPLSDDGLVRLQLGAAYATEFGAPGTNPMAPPVAGKDKGFKVSPSLGVAWSPWKDSELRGSVQPSFTEALSISEKRPAVLLGSWAQRSDDPNWWQYKLSAIAELGDKETIGAIPRFQANAVLDKVFIVNPDIDLGITIGIGAQSTYLAEQGAQSRKPFQIPVRIGAVKEIELFGGKYELNVTANVIPGRDDLPEVSVETSLQKKN